MSGEIEQLTRRTVVGAVGFDKDGLAGFCATPVRPYLGLVCDSTYPQGNIGTQYFKGYASRIMDAPLLGAVAVFPNHYGSSETSAGTTNITHLMVEYPIGTFTNWTFDGGSQSKTMTGKVEAETDPCTVDAPEGALVRFWIMADNAGGMPYTSESTYMTKSQFSASAITDNLGTGSTSGMSDSNSSFMPMAFKGYTSKPSWVILDNSRGIDGYQKRGTPAVGDVMTAISPSMAVANLSVGGAGMWMFGFSNSDRRAAVLGPLVTGIMVGDWINDTISGDSLASQKGNLAAIFAKWDPNNRKRHACKTTDPYSMPGTVSISSITQTGGLATVTCASTANLRTGQNVLIAGATPTAYNGVKQITVASSTTFTFSIASGTTSPATGTLTYVDGYSNQTIAAAFSAAKDAVRQLFNYDLRRFNVEGVHIVVDTARVAEDPADPSKWAMLMMDPDTSDGLHGNQYCQGTKARAVDVGRFGATGMVS